MEGVRTLRKLHRPGTRRDRGATVVRALARGGPATGNQTDARRARTADRGVMESGVASRGNVAIAGRRSGRLERTRLSELAANRESWPSLSSDGLDRQRAPAHYEPRSAWSAACSASTIFPASALTIWPIRSSSRGVSREQVRRRARGRAACGTRSTSSKRVASAPPSRAHGRAPPAEIGEPAGF